MGEINEKTLKNIATKILNILESQPNSITNIEMKNYHGFIKGRIPNELLSFADQDKIQAEIVRVTKDLSDEIHIHKKAHAYCIILGSKQKFKSPKNALSFLHNKWIEISEEDHINIPPNTKHGFTIKPGGNLHFLSIQSPPIESVKGDDYYRVDNQNL